MPEPSIMVSSPSVLPLAVHGSRGFQASLGVALEQPRVRVKGGMIESQGDPGLLGDELTVLSGVISGLLASKKVVSVYDAARYAELQGWRGSLATAGFAYGGLLMVAGSPRGLQPVVSRFHVPSDFRIVVTDLPCRARPRSSLRSIVRVMYKAGTKDPEGLVKALEKLAAPTLKECSVLEHLRRELAGRAAVGASPTGLLYIIGRGINMCRLGELLLDLGLTEGSIITGPQNYGARVEASVGKF